MKNIKAFSLAELVVVVTILAILSTIAFVGYKTYTLSARDAKRVSDTTSLIAKINTELHTGKQMKELVLFSHNNNVVIDGDTKEVPQGIVNFDAIKISQKNFQDPSNGEDYPIAYIFGGTGTGAYKFIEMATVVERDNVAKIIGNYYKINETTDYDSLFVNTVGPIVDGGKNLPYRIDQIITPESLGE